MNRNVESHFAQLPHADIQRSTFDRSAGYKTTFNAGQLIPFYVDEVLPGDTFDITTSKVVRSQTLLTPLMDNMYLDTYYFFVPNRLVWDHWREFCGENTESAWAPATTYSMPVMSGTVLQGSLADYMGLPVGVNFESTDSLSPMALPFRAYALICNEFFRDENLTDPLNIPLGDANQTFPDSSASDPVNDIANGGKPFIAAKYHDYFTSSLPAPQKGDPVTIPVDFSSAAFPVTSGPLHLTPGLTSLSPLTQADDVTASPGALHVPLYYPYSVTQVEYDANQIDFRSLGIGDAVPQATLHKASLNAGATAANSSYSNVGMLFSGANSTSVDDTVPYVAPNGSVSSANNTLAFDSTLRDPNLAISGSGSVGYVNPLPANLWATTGDGFIADSQITVNEMRLAFALQRYLETLARSGSRYTELLLGLFGVRSPDARLQRPEYLGGNRIPIQVDEVTNTAQAEQDFLGDLGAKSLTADVNHDFIKSFTEHGLIIGLMCVRYDHSYSQGINRMWTRKSFEDFYNPKFAHLGEVPVYQAELMAQSPDSENDVPGNLGANGSTPTVFGYQEIWAEYRYRPNIVTSEMRPGADQSLAYWNLADYYTDPPVLSDDWIRETTANVNRVLAVSSDVANQFWCDIYIKNKATRPMPMYSVPGLIDHF